MCYGCLSVRKNSGCRKEHAAMPMLPTSVVSDKAREAHQAQPMSTLDDPQLSLQIQPLPSYRTHRTQHLHRVRLVSLKPQRPFEKKLVFILGALCAFGPISLDLYLPSLPLLSRNLDASASLAQVTLSACLLGLALGQVIAGPVSDALGRRRPLLVGLAVYALTSFLCVIAPSIFVLIVLRFMQGLAGATGIVIARSMARDMYSGTVAARFFSTLTVVSGLAPILAPLFGGMLLHFTNWRGVFVALT